MSKCTCYPVPFEDCITYGSAVEPGSAFEPNPDCPEHFPKGWATYNRKMAVSLVAIQELHKPSDVEEFFNTLDGGTDSRIVWVCERCEDPDSNGYEQYPCETRRLVDEALGK